MCSARRRAEGGARGGRGGCRRRRRTRLQPGLHVIQGVHERLVPHLLAHRVADVEELGVLRRSPGCVVCVREVGVGATRRHQVQAQHPATAA